MEVIRIHIRIPDPVSGFGLDSPWWRSALSECSCFVLVSLLFGLQREHSLFGTVMSALSLTRSSVVADSSYLPATAMLGVDAVGGSSSKVSPTNSLQCPRAVKGPVAQNSISVRDLFPAAYARSSAAAAVKTEPAANDSTATAANHVPATRPAALSTPQIICNSPSNYSPMSSSNKSTATGSPDRLY